LNSTDVKFNSHWRLRCSIRPCSITEIDLFIQAHYLRKRPAIVTLGLQAMDEENPIGCCVFALPPRETHKRYGGTTWELARLYLLDDIPRNAETWLIGQSIKWVRKYHPAVKTLVSYADPSAGHTGLIYKASNWIPDGQTDDERKTPRSDYYDERTGKKYGRRSHMPVDAIITRKPRQPKLRFYYPLEKQRYESTNGR
jgi:hypothetical protein